MRAPKHACANHERMMGNDTVAEMAEVMVGSVFAYAFRIRLPCKAALSYLCNARPVTVAIDAWCARRLTKQASKTREHRLHEASTRPKLTMRNFVFVCTYEAEPRTWCARRLTKHAGKSREHHLHDAKAGARRQDTRATPPQGHI